MYEDVEVGLEWSSLHVHGFVLAPPALPSEPLSSPLLELELSKGKRPQPAALSSSLRGAKDRMALLSRWEIAIFPFYVFTVVRRS